MLALLQDQITLYLGKPTNYVLYVDCKRKSACTYFTTNYSVCQENNAVFGKKGNFYYNLGIYSLLFGRPMGITHSLQFSALHETSKVHLDHKSVIPIEKGVRRLLVLTVHNLQSQNLFQPAWLGYEIEDHFIAPVDDPCIFFQSLANLLRDQAVAVRGNDRPRTQLPDPLDGLEKIIDIGIVTGIPRAE